MHKRWMHYLADYVDRADVPEDTDAAGVAVSLCPALRKEYIGWDGGPNFEGMTWHSGYAANAGGFGLPWIQPRIQRIEQAKRPGEQLMMGDGSQGWWDGGVDPFWHWSEYPGPAGGEMGGYVFQPETPADRDRGSPLPLAYNHDRDEGQTFIRYRHQESRDGWNGNGRAAVLYFDGHAELADIGTLEQQNMALTY